jgi:glycine hydroxymethyltransferase
MSYLQSYFKQTQGKPRLSTAIAFFAGLDAIHEQSLEIAQSILQELKDQRTYLKLIASENFSSLPVQLAMGNLFSDKYSEGFVHHRFYAGCANVDTIEELAMHYAKKVFQADHAYMQPHSGTDANLVALWAILTSRIETPEIRALAKKTVQELTEQEYEKIRQLLVNQKIMGLSLNSGGHLTHGYRMNVSAKMMRAVFYDVHPETHLIDYQQLAKRVKEEKPLILIAGYSAYSRLIDFAKMREIADSVNAVLLVDMAHFAGLVAGKVFKGNYNPVPFAHVLTSTTHKTLRGPRGGMILCTNEFKEAIDKGCPLVLGGPLPHVIAAKALALKEADSAEFCTYAQQIVNNAQAFVEHLQKKNVAIVSGKTDNHLFLIDVHRTFSLTGRQAEIALRKGLITVNRNTIPGDTQGPWYTSGVRIGTPAMTTLGMKEREMHVIADHIVDLLSHTKPAMRQQSRSLKNVYIEDAALLRVQQGVKELLQDFPLYPELLLEEK